MAILTERNHELNRWYMILLSISNLHMSYFISIFNPLGLPLLQGYYGLDDANTDIFNGNLALFFSSGAFLGTTFLGKMSDAIGRLRMLIMIETASAIICLMYSIPNLYVLQFTRFLSGFVGGVNNPLSGIILVEMLPKHLAEIGNMIIYIVGASSMILSYILPYLISKDQMTNHWRLILCWPVVFHVFRAFYLIRYFRDYETPKWTCLKYCQEIDLRDRIKHRLQMIYQDSNLEEEITECVGNNAIPFDSSENMNTLKGVFSSKMIKRTMSAILVNFGQEVTGVSFLIYYSTILFDSINGTGRSTTIIFGISNIIGGLVGAGIVERYSEISILVYGCYIQGVCLIFMIVFVVLEMYWPLYLLVIIYMISYASGMGATLNLYVNQICPPMAVSLGAATSWIGCALVGKICPLALTAFGPNKLVTFFGGGAIFTGLVIKNYCYDNEEDRKKEAAKELHEVLMSPKVC